MGAKENYTKKNYMRVNVVLPKTLGERFKEKCNEQEVSMNYIIAGMVEDYVKSRKLDLLITLDGEPIARPSTYQEAMDVLTNFGEDYSKYELTESGKPIAVQWFNGKVKILLPQ